MSEITLTLEEEIDNIHTEMMNIKTSISTLATHIVSFKKRFEKELKKQQKESGKKDSDKNKVPVEKKEKVKKTTTKKTPPEPPSGFTKPTTISEDLCNFLDKPIGSEMTRPEVTKELHNYIQKNKLQDSDKKMNIKPNQELQKLLGIEEGHELTYFNIQPLINKHFIHPKEE